jgi:hypothetical protein
MKAISMNLSKLLMLGLVLALGDLASAQCLVGGPCAYPVSTYVPPYCNKPADQPVCLSYHDYRVWNYYKQLNNYFTSAEGWRVKADSAQQRKNAILNAYIPARFTAAVASQMEKALKVSQCVIDKAYNAINSAEAILNRTSAPTYICSENPTSRCDVLTNGIDYTSFTSTLSFANLVPSVLTNPYTTTSVRSILPPLEALILNPANATAVTQLNSALTLWIGNYQIKPCFP